MRPITIILLIAIAVPMVLLCFVACDESAAVYCVDDQDKAQDESLCDNDDVAAQSSPTHPRSHHWYYMGIGASRTVVIHHGTKVTGGSYAPHPNRTYFSPHSHKITPRPAFGNSRPSTFRSAPNVRSGFGSTNPSVAKGRRP